ncbi:hypothetical protein DP939_36375 [Spongiactinospora rosea]|uniref:Uncharacterized protein n=1 Tax=Spongiactinospora rosea TaxID=2248750 RepID=A0A366LN46_9ACTN|nr:hypothetical protein [Spongiactinospora rosea]RBQ15321.1 hypothetical protein DP939_36375 [Spongiactinospora rosea]
MCCLSFYFEKRYLFGWIRGRSRAAIEAAGHDELAERRFGKKVDRLKTLMEASLRPAYRGYHGQLVLTDQQVGGEIGDMAEVRRTARAAGRALV